MTSAPVKHIWNPGLGSLFTSVVTLDGYAAILSDQSVDQTNSDLAGMTVAKTITGEYTFTLDQSYYNIISVIPHWQVAGTSPTAVFAQAGPVTATTFIVNTVNGSGARVAAASGAINFQVRVQLTGPKR